MKKFFKEFRDFIMKGNVLNLAVGVIIGAAFQGLVKALTDDIISPIIGLFANADFSEWQWVIKSGADGSTVAIKYGSFITAVINFLIMAFVIFIIVKFMNKLCDLNPLKHKEEQPKPTTKKCPYCLSEIPIEATRCPHCTSEIPEATEENEEKAEEN